MSVRVPAERALEIGDRVERRGDKGTIIYVHGKIAYSVFTDTRQRSQGSLVWPQGECTRLPPASGCPRCGDRHTIHYCPEGL